jgi:DNA-directed RNA polymerase I subunit RPA43
VTFVWLTADFLVFRPSPGTYLQAEVNLQDEGVLGLIVYNYFNIAIPRENLPPDWNWDGEKWVNEKGGIEKDIVCKVVDFEPSGQESISITGTLVGI